MKFRVKLQKPKLNVSKYRAALDKTLKEALAKAAFIWIETTAEAVIPVWSGASRATFLALADKIDCHIAINPVVADRIDLGRDYGTAQYAAGSEVPGVYYFTYVSTLPHLYINENYDVSEWIHLIHPGPYHFQEKGQQALREYVSSIVYPGAADFIEVRNG